MIPLVLSLVYSSLAYMVTVRLIPKMKDMFLAANLGGIDLCKRNRNVKIPEALGVLTGCVFLVTLFLFIPVPFSRYLMNDAKQFPHHECIEYISALLSICCMILLGFADDVLNLKWRHKLLLPTIASLPLLMVYYVNFNSTTVIMPNIVRPWIGTSLNIGFLYYIFMGMLAVFCTNAINILAGVNGLETGQSIVVALSVIVFNFIEILRDYEMTQHHFSLYLLLPYLATTFALWKFNKFPSQVFVGDTFNYLSGMTFAVVGILGHFSKTLLLFFIPQILNFLYSVPQLFHFVPCPRHRLPKYNPDTDLLEMSTTTFRMKDLNVLGKLFVRILRLFRVIKWEEKSDGQIITNNFTIINLAILFLGPIRENRLTKVLLAFQIFCSCVAFVIRYPLAAYFYDYQAVR